MGFKRKFSGNILKSFWVGLCLFILQLGLICHLTDPGFGSTQNDLLAFMGVLSFPSGAVMAVVFEPFFDYDPFSFTFLWFCTFVAGYVQWFVVIPEIRDSGIISLGLSTKPATENRSNLPATTSNEKPARPRARKFPRRTHLVRAFDKQGRTPLERALMTRPRRY